MATGREMSRHGFVRDQGSLPSLQPELLPTKCQSPPTARLPQRLLRLIVKLVCG